MSDAQHSGSTPLRTVVSGSQPVNIEAGAHSEQGRKDDAAVVSYLPLTMSEE